MTLEWKRVLWCPLLLLVIALFPQKVLGKDSLVLDGLIPGLQAVTQDVQILKDPDGSLTFDEVSGPLKERFQPTKGRISLGRTPIKALWIRFAVTRPLNDPFHWDLLSAPAFLDHVEIWTPSPNGYEYKTVGRNALIDDRDKPFSGFAVSMNPPMGKTMDVFIRVETKTILRTELWVATKDSVARYGMKYGLILGFILGFIIFSGLVNIIVGVWLKDSTYLSFGLYSFLLSIAAMLNDGYTNYYFPNFHGHGDIIQGVAMCAVGAVGIWFSIQILQIRRYYPRFVFIFYLSIVIDIILAIFVLFGHYEVMPSLFLPKALFLTVMALIISAHQTWRGNASSALILIGYTTYISGAIYDILSLYANLPMISTSIRPAIFGALFQVISFGLGLAHRIRTVTLENQRVQAAALHASRSAEATLSAKVAERTSLLEAEIAWRRRIEADLTNAKIRAEEALSVQNVAMREQRNFLSMVSHEFRTPLGIISASTELLKLEIPHEVLESREELEKIRRAQNRMVKLVDTCLSDDWLESASATRRSALLDLQELLGDCADFYPSVTLAFQEDSRPLVVDGDPTLLPVVFANLMDNAQKYSAKSATIDVATRIDSNRVIVDIMDRGIGIAEDDMTRIFEKYFRASAAHNKPGAGIGLHLVRRILALHNGDVEVHARPGGGTIFSVYLPLASPQ